MQKVVISEKEAGQRLSKYLEKFMPYAPKSFFYKMMRKKNIVLNGKKAEGMERLKENDNITFFLSEETIGKFQQNLFDKKEEKKSVPISIVYEDPHILIMNKPVGMLSQKAYANDISVIEHMTDYFLQSKFLTLEELRTFHPAVCNRLDRNTSGLIIGGKTIRGLQEMNALLKERSVDKYYLTIVSGHMKSKQRISGYLIKDHNKNQVSITKTPSKDADYICTEYEPLLYTASNSMTFLKVKLITGKSHQIRAQLKSLGFPVIGDRKYGDMKLNKKIQQDFLLTHHLLHSYEIQFPKLSGCLSELSGKKVQAQIPEEFLKILSILFLEK